MAQNNGRIGTGARHRGSSSYRHAAALLVAGLLGAASAGAGEWSVRGSLAGGSQDTYVSDHTIDGPWGMISGEAALKWLGSGGLYVQGSVAAERYYETDGAHALPLWAWMLGLHVGYQSPDGWTVGALAARQRVGISVSVDQDTGYLFAGEVSRQWSQFSVHGQVGVGTHEVDGATSSTPEGFISGRFVRLLARMFPSSRTMFEFSYLRAYTPEYTDGNHAGIWADIEARVEYRLSGPVSVFGSLRDSAFQADDEDESVQDRALLIGLMVRLGGGADLRAFERYGASFSLPMGLARGAAYTEAVD